MRIAGSAGYFCSQDKGPKMFYMFCKWVIEKIASNHEKVRDDYLAQAVDQADLEHRLRNLERKGWLI